jgi:hypothetical protein
VERQYSRHAALSPKTGVLLGRFTYDSTIVVDFDDRLLAHLQLVIGAKLRRHESFQFSWVNDPADGSGRASVWLSPSLPLGFKYQGVRMPDINVAWVEALMATANSAGGLRIVPEPPQN